VRLGLDWSATDSSAEDALGSKQVQLKALNIETAPLRGLDKRVAEAREQMKAFYAQRIPASYSGIATHVGTLEVGSGVRLTRLLYTQGAPTGDLTEISLDVSGSYPQIMKFVNGLERDQDFFVVRAMTLTGQQGGLVNLRIKLSTWLRAADVPSGLPETPAEPAATATPNGEGQ
jgi:Tfp pilus assembly protein PilO